MYRAALTSTLIKCRKGHSWIALLNIFIFVLIFVFEIVSEDWKGAFCFVENLVFKTMPVLCWYTRSSQVPRLVDSVPDFTQIWSGEIIRLAARNWKMQVFQAGTAVHGWHTRRSATDCCRLLQAPGQLPASSSPELRKFVFNFKKGKKMDIFIF